MTQYPIQPEENNRMPVNHFSVPKLKIADDCLAFARKINPNHEELTVEVLRRFPGCEQYSDEEADDVVNAVHQLTDIIFKAIYENDSVLIGMAGQTRRREAIPITAIEHKNLAA